MLAFWLALLLRTLRRARITARSLCEFEHGVLAFVSNVLASFAHYMIGQIEDGHTYTDVKNAKDLGIDGFALNIGKNSNIALT